MWVFLKDSVTAMFLLIFQQRDQERAGTMTLDFQGDIWAESFSLETISVDSTSGRVFLCSPDLPQTYERRPHSSIEKVLELKIQAKINENKFEVRNTYACHLIK